MATQLTLPLPDLPAALPVTSLDAPDSPTVDTAAVAVTAVPGPEQLTLPV